MTKGDCNVAAGEHRGGLEAVSAAVDSAEEAQAEVAQAQEDPTAADRGPVEPGDPGDAQDAWGALDAWATTGARAKRPRLEARAAGVVCAQGAEQVPVAV